MEDATQWLTKRQAAALTGLKTRRILQLAADGTLRSKRERDPINKQLTVFVDRAAVEKYIQDSRPRSMEVQSGAPETQALQPRSWSAPEPLSVVIAHLAKQLQTPPCTWLTLEAAEQECGLSRAHLLHAIRIGELPARRDEPIRRNGEGRAKAGSSWRVCRRDLDALQGAPYARQSLHA